MRAGLVTLVVWQRTMAAVAADSTAQGQATLAAVSALHAHAITVLSEALKALQDTRHLADHPRLEDLVQDWCLEMDAICQMQGVAEPSVMNLCWKAILVWLRAHHKRIPANLRLQPLLTHNLQHMQNCFAQFLHLCSAVRHTGRFPSFLSFSCCVVLISR
jgi:hypothetical protein